MSTNSNLFAEVRKSRMDMNEVYFWTDTIKDWKHLLKEDKYKELLIDIWGDLVYRDLIAIYGFVIMPNHLHVIWEMLSRNGKEMPYASFNKASSHLIVRDLKACNPSTLPSFKTDEPGREFRIWQRDPLATLMDSPFKLEQKLDYLHFNPLQEHWNLADRPENYYWSSAAFYERNDKGFDFITDYRKRFG